MASEPMMACVGLLQQAGWQLAPTANPWHVVTELHAHRWWDAYLVDTATLSLLTDQGCGQRVQLIAPPAGSGTPRHQILGSTGLVSVERLPPLLADWPIPMNSPAPQEPPSQPAEPSQPSEPSQPAE